MIHGGRKRHVTRPSDMASCLALLLLAQSMVRAGADEYDRPRFGNCQSGMGGCARFAFGKEVPGTTRA